MSTTETLLPDVGAKIRVTYTHAASGDTATTDVTVKRVDVDDKPGDGKPYVLAESGAYVMLHGRDGWTVTWEVLEAAPKPLPAEPAVMGVVEIDNKGSILFRRVADTEHGYVDLTNPRAGYYSWAEVCALGTPVPLVAAPDLAELVEALRKAAEGWHDRNCGTVCGDPVFTDCGYADCLDFRALLARHAGEQADRA